LTGAAPTSSRYVVPTGKTLRDVVWEQKKAQWAAQQPQHAPQSVVKPTSQPQHQQQRAPAPNILGQPPQQQQQAQAPPAAVPTNAIQAQQLSTKFGRRATPPTHNIIGQQSVPWGQAPQPAQQAPQQSTSQQQVDTGRPPSFGRRAQQQGTRPW
jgi:hypothetical protein